MVDTAVEIVDLHAGEALPAGEFYNMVGELRDKQRWY